MERKRKTEGLNQYVKFSGMGLQMGITIAIFAYAGYWLDGKFETESPYYTAGLSLIGVFASLFLMIKQLPKN